MVLEKSGLIRVSTLDEQSREAYVAIASRNGRAGKNDLLLSPTRQPTSTRIQPNRAANSGHGDASPIDRNKQIGDARHGKL